MEFLVYFAKSKGKPVIVVENRHVADIELLSGEEVGEFWLFTEEQLGSFLNITYKRPSSTEYSVKQRIRSVEAC